MSNRAAAWLAWSLWAIFVVLQAAAVLLAFLARSYEEPSEYVLPLLSRILLFLPTLVAFPTVGALIASRRPTNPIGWLLIVIGILGATGGFAEGYWRYALVVQPGSLPAGELMLWIGSRPYNLNIVPIMLAMMLFPTGRPPSPRWWIAGWLVVAGIVITELTAALKPGSLVEGMPIDNPLGIPGGAGVLEMISTLGGVLMLLGVLGVASSLIVRTRRARGVERQQLKWFAYSATLFIVAFILSFFSLSPQLDSAIFVLWTLTAAFVAIAIGIAILRYRLYDIDLLINRTLVYGSLTAMLVAAYLGSVVALQGLLRALTGQESQLAVVASTLAIAALFSPLRRRVQAFIDRRFYRRKYDAAKTLEAFSAKLRDETDLDTLNNHLVEVVKETMQPAHVSLWLRPDANRKGEQPD